MKRLSDSDPGGVREGDQKPIKILWSFYCHSRRLFGFALVFFQAMFIELHQKGPLEEQSNVLAECAMNRKSVLVCRMELRDNFIFRCWLRKTSSQSLNNACEGVSRIIQYWSPPGEFKWIWWRQRFDYYYYQPPPIDSPRDEPRRNSTLLNKSRDYWRRNYICSGNIMKGKDIYDELCFKTLS